MCWVSPPVSYGLLWCSYSWSSVSRHTLLPWISAAPFANANSSWKLLTSNPISLGFLRCLSVFALPFCNMFEYDQSLKSSVIKSSVRQFETCRVYFIMGCSDSRRAILVTVAAAVCFSTGALCGTVTPKINKERDMCVYVCLMVVCVCLLYCVCLCEYICWKWVGVFRRLSLKNSGQDLKVVYCLKSISVIFRAGPLKCLLLTDTREWD